MPDLYVAPTPHFCTPPGCEAAPSSAFRIFTPSARPAGSVWQCDDDSCRMIWQAVHSLLGPQWKRADDAVVARYRRATSDEVNRLANPDWVGDAAQWDERR